MRASFTGQLDTESLSGRLLFAIPKKGERDEVLWWAAAVEVACPSGRLHDTCLELLAGTFFTLTTSGGRLSQPIFRCRHPISKAPPPGRLSILKPQHCAVSRYKTPRGDSPLILTYVYRVFLPAADIPSFVGKGNVDVGITGHDVILEAEMQDHVDEALRLNFGKCALQVQVPESSPYKCAADLAGKRVVTSFEVMVGKFFGKIDDDLNLVGENRTKIEYVGGSVEAACSLGLADGIGT